MGRKTWQLDLNQRPLPNRWNIVISSSLSQLQNVECLGDRASNLTIVDSLAKALQTCQQREKAFIIGGASIYSQTLTLTDTWELTLVEGEFSGDIFFPEYQHLIGKHYKLVAQETHPGYRFETYRKKPLRLTQTSEVFNQEQSITTNEVV